MGYTTEFYGEVSIDPPFTPQQADELNAFADERHGGNIDADPGMPGFWCQWIASPGGESLTWDGGEKFYESEEWMRYLINRFVVSTGRVANGEIEAAGEELSDRWLLVVENNVVSRKSGRYVYE